MITTKLEKELNLPEGKNGLVVATPSTVYCVSNESVTALPEDCFQSVPPKTRIGVYPGGSWTVVSGYRYHHQLQHRFISDGFHYGDSDVGNIVDPLAARRDL